MAGRFLTSEPSGWSLQEILSQDLESFCGYAFLKNNFLHNVLLSIHIFNFIYLFLAVPGLFPSCGEWRLLSYCGSWVSHCSGFSCCGTQALGIQASVVVAHGLSCSVAYGIFPDQGW